jgi:ATP-dependent RNA helicase DeaD
VVVGTPGRVIDLIERKSLRLDGVTFAVLDEADEMLRMGFAEDVDRILTEVPAGRQTALFSATMPKEIRRVAAQHLRQPVDVSVAASATPVANIEQRYIVLPFRDKAVALQRVIAAADAEAAVVFVRTRSACDELGSALIAGGMKAAFISGDVSQNERERTIDRLRGGQVDVLVATDVAARGMDVERIGLVVNFDAPADPETYIHRVGRTGRAGRAGQAVTFFTPKETSRLRFIEKTIGRKLEEIDVPSAAQVRDRQAEAALAAAVNRHTAGRLDSYLSALTVAADIAGLSRDELAAALLATVVGDDGTAPVEIRTTRRDRQDGAGRPRRDRDRDRDRDRQDAAPRRSRGESGRDRYEGAPRRGRERPESTGRRAYRDANRQDAPSRDAQFHDRPHKSKPRWDSARRAERDASTQGHRDARQAGFGGRSGGRTDGGRTTRTPPNSQYRDRRPVA